MVDWSLRIRPPKWMPRRAYVTAVSQLYHGELATLAMCHDLRDSIDNSGLSKALNAQISDEMRHMAIYERYLERLGDIAPPEPALQAALDGHYVWPGSPLGTIVAVHLLLEGEGLRVQHEYGRWFPCELLRQIHRIVSPDEARHITFGRRTIGRYAGQLPQEERIGIFRWLETLWHDGAQASQTDLPVFIRRSLGRRWMDE